MRSSLAYCITTLPRLLSSVSCI